MEVERRSPDSIGWVLGLSIYGGMNYARGKGKSMAFGLVGFLGIIGLMILFAIKEESVDNGGLSDTVITWEGGGDSSDGQTTITVVDRSN